MILDCLIVKAPWSDLILDGKKKLEIRGCRTSKRGIVGIIEGGSGEIKGLVDIAGCRELTEESFDRERKQHCIQNVPWQMLPYKKVYGWQMKYPTRFKKPVKYNHPKGAVLWVRAEVPDEEIQKYL